jgi:NADH dehydrogenase
MNHIVVIGGGFAGLWSAAGAARQRHELEIPDGELQITLVSRDAYHSIRVRNYEADLSEVRVPLNGVLDPIGVRHMAGDVTGIDVNERTVTVAAKNGPQTLTYDRLVIAAGSEVAKPPVPGLTDHAFSIDTFDEAMRLQRHIDGLGGVRAANGAAAALIVGAGLTGIETACEMPARLRAVLPPGAKPRVILADHAAHIGSTMGDSAIPVIQEALDALHIESRTGARITAIDREGATLDTGERINAGTIIWTAGMRATGLTALVPGERDQFGRLHVDEYMRVQGVDGVFATGDAARLLIDGAHPSVMSCQHARPMGRFAGHNVVCDLLGHPMLPLQIGWYVTVLDLGPWGAVYTHGWDRKVVAAGPQAKQTKQMINCVRIYPPVNRNPEEIFAAAAPTIQQPPERYN